MKRIFSAFIMVMALAANVAAQDEVPASAWGNTPPLHVEGKHFCDPYGNPVVLHGVMDTPSGYFNGWRWTKPWEDHTTKITECKAYFKKLFDAMTDTKQGAYCKIFRLHLDPCWTNNNNTKAAGFKEENGKIKDPHGNEVSGEASIYHFNKTRLKNYLRSVYVPIALDAIKHGMYVIMRPPGVFPHYVEVGDYYNDYLMTVWDIVTQNADVQKYSGQIMIELGNEPVNLKGKGGASSATAMHDFFQPIVDKMRSNGFDGIILGVGTGYQSGYADYDKYPLVGKNIGYAVHVYSGWYGAWDENCNHQNFITQFGKQVPVANNSPIVVTEIDWSPDSGEPDLDGNGKYQYNPDGSLKTKNYGTWATGTTSKWGKAWRAVHDHYGNIGMTLTGTSDYLDIDDYLNNKKVTPAFTAAMEKKGVDPMEACGKACFVWYKEWAGVNYARPDLMTVEAPLTELKGAEGSVTCMVGQYVDLGLEGKFEDGLTSKIPAWMCNIEGNDKDICLMRSDEKFVAAGEGTTTMKVSFAGKSNEGVEKECQVEVLPAFSVNKKVFNPSITAKGTYASTATRGTLKTAPNGMGGWEFNAGIDLTAANYLVMEFYQAPKCAAVVNITDDESPTASFFTQKVDAKQIKIDLKNMQKADGTPVDVSNIKIVAFTSNGSDNIYIKSVYISNDGETPAEAKPTVGIQSFEVAKASVVAEEYYTLSGQRIDTPAKGVNIIRQTLSNGTKRTLKVFEK